jgi:hypothetical protein
MKAGPLLFIVNKQYLRRASSLHIKTPAQPKGVQGGR